MHSWPKIYSLRCRSRALDRGSWIQRPVSGSWDPRTYTLDTGPICPSNTLVLLFRDLVTHVLHPGSKSGDQGAHTRDLETMYPSNTCFTFVGPFVTTIFHLGSKSRDPGDYTLDPGPMYPSNTFFCTFFKPLLHLFFTLAPRAGIQGPTPWIQVAPIFHPGPRSRVVDADIEA